MQRVLIIGCGKLARAVVPLISKNSVYFREICLSGRSKEKCDTYKTKYSNDKQKIMTAFVDVKNKEKTRLMANIYHPDLVINLAPSYLNTMIMELCLDIGANYIDASLYTPKGESVCNIDEEYSYDARFQEKGLTAVIGCGFNPGVVNAFAQYSAIKLLDHIDSVDVIDMNAGENSNKYLMNTSMMTSLHQVSSDCRMWSSGELISYPPTSVKASFNFPDIGKKDLYMVDHEVIDALSGELPEAQSIRFFSAFKEPFLSMVRVLDDLGMTSTKPVSIDGQQIVPLDFLYEVMPQQEDLAATATGKNGIGVLVRGTKDGQAKKYLIYSLVDHKECFEKYGSSSTDFLAAAPLVAGAGLIALGIWKRPGVHMISEFDPLPFFKEIQKQGLDYKVIETTEEMELLEN